MWNKKLLNKCSINVWNNLMADENDETNSKLEILLDSIVKVIMKKKNFYLKIKINLIK